MKCPDCGGKLKPIGYAKGEWICDNADCPTNKKLRGQGYQTYAEFYGDTQKEINEQKRSEPPRCKKCGRMKRKWKDGKYYCSQCERPSCRSTLDGRIIEGRKLS